MHINILRRRNRLSRAHFKAFATVDTLLRIDHSKIVIHMDSQSRTDLYASLTGNTADFAMLAGLTARPVVPALDFIRLMILRDHEYKLLRTGRNTLLT